MARVLGLVVLAAALGVPAAAQATGSPPNRQQAGQPGAATSPCTRAITDPAGDAGITPPHAPVRVVDGPANTDITGVGFTYGRDGSGRPRLTASISIAALDRQVMTGSTRHRYSLLMSWVRPDRSEGLVLLEAIFDLNGVEAFHYGHLEELAGGLFTIVRDGPTTGRFIEGANGMIEVDVPVEALKLDGSRVGMEGATASVETGATAETEIPAPVADQGVGFQTDYTERQFRLDLAACGAVPDVQVPQPSSAPAPATALPRLASRRLRSVRGRVRIPLTCAKAAPCEAAVRVGARSVAVRMKAGSRTVAVVRLARAQARRLRRGRRVKVVVRIGNPVGRSRQRVTVIPR